MHVHYVCDFCGRAFAQLELPALDEQRLGLTALTREERADIIIFDPFSGNLTLKSICDACAEKVEPVIRPRWMH